jgi:integrase
MTIGMGRPKRAWFDLPPRMTARRLKKSVRYYYQAAGKKIPLGTNLLAAKEEWARLEASGPRLLFPGVARLYRETFKDFSVSTKDHYERALRNLEVYFRRYALEQIQPRHVKQYLRKRSKKGAALFEKRVGSALFNWARGEGHTTVPNPFQGVTFSRAEKRAYQPLGRRKTYVSSDMFKSVYDAGDDILRDAMDLAYLTGQRPGDVLKMRRADIVDGVLWVDQQKTHKRVGIEVRGELGVVLERILTRSRPIQSVYLISDRRGQRVLPEALGRRFRKARGEATWQFRDIRARTASDADSLKRAQELLGHESEQTTAQVYRRAKGSIVAPLEPKKTA